MCFFDYSQLIRGGLLFSISSKDTSLVYFLLSRLPLLLLLLLSELCVPGVGTELGGDNENFDSLLLLSVCFEVVGGYKLSGH